VLWEDNFKAGYITGYTENYVKVKALWDPDLVNQKQVVNLTEIDDDGLVRATIASPQPV
jgi:threonylcarbamoyladenosine tRNA methylthiotransferase MtaB